MEIEQIVPTVSLNSAYGNLALDAGTLLHRLVNTGDVSVADNMHQLVDDFEAAYQIPRLTPEVAPFIPDTEYTPEIYVSGELFGIRLLTDSIVEQTEPNDDTQEILEMVVAKMGRALRTLEFSAMPYAVMDAGWVAAQEESVCGKRYVDGVSYALERVYEHHRIVMNSQIGRVYHSQERSPDDRKFVVLGYTAMTWLTNMDVARRHFDRPMFATLEQLLADETLVRLEANRLHITPAGADFVKGIAATLL